jgi:hypothetical protein
MENEASLLVDRLDMEVASEPQVEDQATPPPQSKLTPVSVADIASVGGVEIEAETINEGEEKYIDCDKAEKKVMSDANVTPDPIIASHAEAEVSPAEHSTDPIAATNEAEQPKIALAPRPYILFMTQDSLHSIASFLTPFEWCSFGQTSKSASKLCNETTRHVRLHGFRCAQEVVTAWKLGQHEDAKELAALYIASGVPIYPRSLGHSYHTILWRMGVEAKLLLQEEEHEHDRNAPNGKVDANVMLRESSVDKFYRERLDYRTRKGYNHTISYLSEKCLFWMDERENNGSTSRPVRLTVNQQQNQATARTLRTT